MSKDNRFTCSHCNYVIFNKRPVYKAGLDWDFEPWCNPCDQAYGKKSIKIKGRGKVLTVEREERIITIESHRRSKR